MINHDEPTLYEQLGGEQGIQNLVERFYHYMETRPEVQGIRKLHAQDLATAKERLFWFLSGWSGGPQLFIERRGHPMLRARHLPFPIGKSERDQWMICMVHAIEDLKIEDPLKSDLIDSFLHVADHMRNDEQKQ